MVPCRTVDRVDREARVPLEELLVRAGAAADRRRRRLAAGYGLTPTAIAVLTELGPSDAPSHRELAAALRLSPTTLTPVLDALEAAGAVRRERDTADRRVVRVRRTAAGRERLAAVTAPDPQASLPRPDPRHEPAVRAYLLAVLAAVEAEELGGGPVIPRRRQAPP
jgi:DNA-binding MarR family transcriptional regulator